MAEKPPTVKVTIDGRELEVAPGTLVIRAAEQLGIIIPRFCDHRLLDPLGACRQCLVEVEGQRKPLTACTTRVTDGMVVRTQHTSEVARKAQEGVIEFLLINHPLDCPMCDKGGECPLQDQALAHGPGESRFIEPKRRYPKPLKISETVLLDRERCVLCARCTRFSAEIAGDPFIELYERSALEQVAIDPSEPYRSYFSGNVVQICPVGALTSPSYRFRARPFDLTSTDATCNHCAAGCQLRIDARSGMVLRQLARDDDKVNEAWNCDRGRYGFAYARSPQRVLVPLARQGDELVRASWAEALEAAAAGLRRALERGLGVGVLVGGHLTDQDAYALQKLARVALGTNNVDARSWPGRPGEDAVTTWIAGRPLGPTYADVEAARAVVVVDLDPHEESPILWLRLRKAALKRGTRVIAVGPRPGRLREIATVVPTLPGGEPVALQALTRGEGEAGRLLYEALGIPPGGAGEEDASRPLVVLAGWRAAATDGLAESLRLATRLGGTFAWVPRRAGDRGALDVGARPGLLPGGRPVTSARSRRELEVAWGVELPAEPGLDGPGMLAAAAAGQLGALVLAGVDLVRDYGPRELAERALERAFVVAIDHEVSETTGYADVLFPGAAHAESEGTYTDWEGRVQATHPAIPVGGTAQAVWELADQLALKLGADLGLATYERVAEEVERLRAQPEDGVEVALPPPQPVELAGPAEGLALVTYPLLLDAASLLQGASDLTRTTWSAFVEVHPDDARRLGLASGGRAAVDFGGGRVVTLPVRVSDQVAPGCAFIPANQPDLALGALLGPAPALRVLVRAVEEAAA